MYNRELSNLIRDMEKELRDAEASLSSCVDRQSCLIQSAAIIGYKKALDRVKSLTI